MSMMLALGTLLFGIFLYLHAMFREGDFLVGMEIYFGWVITIVGSILLFFVLFGLL